MICSVRFLRGFVLGSDERPDALRAVSALPFFHRDQIGNLQRDLFELPLARKIVWDLERRAALDSFRLLDNPGPPAHEVMRLVPELMIRPAFVEKEDNQSCPA